MRELVVVVRSPPPLIPSANELYYDLSYANMTERDRRYTSAERGWSNMKNLMRMPFLSFSLQLQIFDALRCSVSLTYILRLV